MEERIYLLENTNAWNKSFKAGPGRGRLGITEAAAEHCPDWGAESPIRTEAPMHDYSELTRSTCKALFTVFSPWVLFSSFVMTSFSSLWAIYSVFHATLAGCCLFCAIVAFELDRKYLAQFALPPLFAAFCLAPLASLPFLQHELAKSGGQWGGDLYFVASLILSGQIYWLLLPVIAAIMFLGPRPILIKSGYIVLFLGMINFALFICLIAAGPLIFDFARDARLLFLAMLCISL